jgi:general secretion pathway protein D
MRVSAPGNKFTKTSGRFPRPTGCRLIESATEWISCCIETGSAKLSRSPRKPCLEDLLRRIYSLTLLAAVGILLCGCPKTASDFEEGKKAEAIQDYDTALVHYDAALRASPTNAEFKLRATHMRFMDAQFHLEKGEKALNAGDLQLAASEFKRAEVVDPSNAAADQELKKTLELIAGKNAATSSNLEAPAPPEDQELLTGPPQLKPLSREPINLKSTNDARQIFEAVARLAGLSVIFDPDFVSKRLTVELPNVTLEQALDTVAMASKAIWKPVTPNVIFVTTDSTAKRKDTEDEVVKTFYISNATQPNDLTEIANGLRTLLALTHVQQVASQNAIVVRDTPDKVLLASKVIDDLDKAKPEVLLHIQVLSANRDRLRDLGILPGQSVALTFNPRTSLQPGSSSSGSGSSGSGSSGTSGSASLPSVTLNSLQHLSSGDWDLTLPGATANAILTDNQTRIIQDPEVRVSDGQEAKVTIGEKVPIATGSFQAGVGVGVGGGAGVVNPLVNTQFTYQDVGVKIDVTPHVHPDGEVSMKVSIEVSSLDGSSNIGGINQPIIASKKTETDIRLKDGESSILTGLIERTETVNTNGIPGVAQLPLLKYLFSDNSKEVIDSEVLLILTPHVVRFPSITADNLRALASGTDSNVRVYREISEAEPVPSATPAAQAAPPAGASTQPASLTTTGNAGPGAPAVAPQLKFDPATVTLKPGETTTLGLSVANVNDLFSIPLLVHYNPAVIQVEDVLNGGFLSGGTQEIAIVQRIDSQHGEIVISATRQPNTPGVSGTGTLMGFRIRAVGPGTASLQILEVNARDSQQRQIPMVSQEATIQVQ